MIEEMTDDIRSYGRSYRMLYTLAMALMLWALFDGIATYIVPLAITQAGISETVMGLIIGSSSFIGLFVDVIIVRIAKRTTYRRYFLWLFLLCAVYPLILWQANNISLFLVAMGVWALYYDLHMFGRLDYVGREEPASHHAHSSSILETFTGVGYVLAPIVASSLVVGSVGKEVFLMMWAVLLLAVAMYGVFLYTIEHNRNRSTKHREVHIKKQSLVLHFRLIETITARIAPVLFFTLLLNVIYSSVWTIGPLFTLKEPGFEHLSGLFVTAFSIPLVLVSWLGSTLSIRFGKKRTAFVAAIFGSAMIATIGFMDAPIGIIVATFLGACGLAIARPAIASAYANYISESEGIEPEFEATQVFFGNLGFIIGPILSGFLADQIGFGYTFTVIGAIGFIISAILLSMHKPNIRVSDIAKAQQ